MKETTAIILAAGESTRMKSATPKVIHSVAGKLLIKHILDELASFPQITRIIIVVGYQSEKIKEALGDGYDYVLQEKQLGTADAVKSCNELLSDFHGDVLVMAGDVPLISAGTISSLLEKYQNENLDGIILTGKFKDPTGYGRIVRKDSNDVCRIVEEIDAGLFEKAIEEINSGIYCFSWDKLRDSLNEIEMNERKKEFYLTDAIELMAKKGHVIDTLILEDTDQIVGVNSRIQLSQVEKKLRKRVNERLMTNGVTIIDPDTTYIDADVTIGADSIIYPFTIIEGAVAIGNNCKIGPFSHIRAGGVLEDEVEIGNFVEVKKCTIGKGTKSKHLTYLGDAKIGSKVNVGAGTIIANYDGKKKHQTTIKDNAFIGSGSILISPVTVGSHAYTGAGSVVLKGRDVPDGAVVIGVPAKILESNKKTTDQSK